MFDLNQLLINYCMQFINHFDFSYKEDSLTTKKNALISIIQFYTKIIH